MARRKEPKLAHPLESLAALEQFHTDVCSLMAVAHNVVSTIDLADRKPAVREELKKQLTEALDRVRRHHQASDQG